MYNVLSLFDGLSSGQLALQRAGIEVTQYYAAEIDKYAIQVTQHNFPNTIQLGDVTKVTAKSLPKIDLIMGGSPCQGFSFAGKQLNFEDPRSQLFFEFVRLVKELKEENPELLFLLENVKMKKEYQDVITEHLGVEPIEINSSLVSAQNRKRLYWTNISGVTQPDDKGILLKDILETNIPYIKTDKKWNIKKFQEKASTLTGGAHSGGNHSDMDILVVGGAIRGRRLDENGIRKDYSDIPIQQYIETFGNQKSNCLSTIEKDNIICLLPDSYRRYSLVECERLQTLPDNYTAGVSNSQRYKMLGNGWTIDVISHIFQNIKEK